MKKFLLIAGLVGLYATPSHAVVCADGVYRTACAGPHGAATVPHGVVRRPMAPHECAAGPYRAGCAGPNGAAVVRRPY